MASGTTTSHLGHCSSPGLGLSAAFLPSPTLTSEHQNHSSTNRKPSHVSSQTPPISFHLAHSQNPYNNHGSPFLSSSPPITHGNQSQASFYHSNQTDTSLPQDLGVCYFLCLEHSSLNIYKALSLTFFKSLLKYDLFNEAFPEYPIYN